MSKHMHPIESIEELAKGGDKLVKVFYSGDTYKIVPASELLVRDALVAINHEVIWWYDGAYDVKMLSDELIASSLDRCSSVDGCEGCVWGQVHGNNDDECVDSLSHEAARRLRRES